MGIALYLVEVLVVSWLVGVVGGHVVMLAAATDEERRAYWRWQRWRWSRRWWATRVTWLLLRLQLRWWWVEWRDTGH